MTWRDDHSPPARPEGRTVNAGTRGARCESCDGLLPHVDVPRCPYVRCRQWFIGTETHPKRCGLPDPQEKFTA